MLLLDQLVVIVQEGLPGERHGGLLLFLLRLLALLPEALVALVVALALPVRDALVEAEPAREEVHAEDDEEGEREGVGAFGAMHNLWQARRIGIVVYGLHTRHTYNIQK